jgi:hypothetical protein
MTQLPGVDFSYKRYFELRCASSFFEPFSGARVGRWQHTFFIEICGSVPVTNAVNCLVIGCGEVEKSTPGHMITELSAINPLIQKYFLSTKSGGLALWAQKTMHKSASKL